MTVAAIAIGRNEGERLKRCLTSLQGEVDRIVYVDSGSTDDSLAFARNLGVTVATLDTATPFTAARARNAGVEALRAGGLPDLIQFIDGDCRIDPGWIAAGVAFLEGRPDVGLVTGWRTEIHPEASIYNAMAEVEWHRPAGEIRACGGDMLVRAAVFDQIGGFNPRLVCSEDEDFVIRLRKAGWIAWRLPRVMTHHDLAMTRFSQWWKRTVRTGHGYAEVGRLHPPHFDAALRRVWVYGGVLPVLAVIGLFTSGWLVLGVLGGYALSWLRTARGLMRDGLDVPMAVHQAAYLTLSKLPNMVGLLTYHWRRLTGSAMRLIEYK
jgi:GT2 family glycosyltransferase